MEERNGGTKKTKSMEDQGGIKDRMIEELEKGRNGGKEVERNGGTVAPCVIGPGVLSAPLLMGQQPQSGQ